LPGGDGVLTWSGSRWPEGGVGKGGVGGSRYVSAVLRSLLDVLFPLRCAACAGRGWPFCRSCSPSVALLVPPGCRRCGRPLEWSVSVCADCPPREIEWSRSAFLYEGAVRRALMRLKFSGVRSVADAMVPAMAEALLISRPPDARSGPWVLTWVPLGRRRRRSRGYDQAEALARGVARLTGAIVRRLLVREVETAPQALRTRGDRRRALRGAFRAVGALPPRVVVVDDVLTTGATAVECARVLLRGGAREVAVLTAARSLGGPIPARCYTPVVLPSGSVVDRETFSRKSMPAAGKATHVRRPLVAEHGAA
jgi:competence protein ComFC